MKIGARAHDYERQEIAPLFARIREDGFETMQLACKKALAGVQTLSDITPPLLDEIQAQLQKNQLTIGVYGSYLELSLTDEPQRAAQAAEFIAQIENARILSAGCIASETTARAKQPHATQAEALRALEKSLAEILPAAQAARMTVAIEPVASHTLCTPELTAALLKTMASPCLRVLFDPVNLMTASALPNQRDLWNRSFDCFGDAIVAVHIKGIRQNAAGELEKTSLADSAIDWAFLAAELQKCPLDFPVLREELVPALAKEDCAWIRSLW